MEFTIPLNYDSLLKKDTDIEDEDNNNQDDDDNNDLNGDSNIKKQSYSVNRYIDVEALSESAQLKILDGINDRISKNPLDIIHHNNFDNLYFFIKSLESEKIPLEVKNQVLKVLQNSIRCFIPVIRKFLSNEVSIDDQYRQQLILIRNTLKINIFLMQYFQHYTAQAVNNASSSTSASAAAIKKRGAKRKVAETDVLWDQESQKEKVLSMIHELLELDLQTLWRLQYPEEAFIRLISKIIYSLMENPNNTKSKAIKQTLFAIIFILIAKYNHTEDFISHCVQLVESKEHLPVPMAEFFYYVLEEKKETEHILLVVKILSSTDRVASKVTHNDTATAKHLSEFVSHLTSLLPKIMMTQSPMIFRMIDYENHSIRNGALESFAHLIKFLANDRTMEKSKDYLKEYVDQLLSRQNDVSGYCRSKLLQIFAHLWENINFPSSETRNQILQLGVMGLSDRVVLVRKNAIHLIYVVVANNMRYARLDSDFYSDLHIQFQELDEDLQKQERIIQQKQLSTETPSSQDDENEASIDEDIDEEQRQFLEKKAASKLPFNFINKITIQKKQLEKLCKDTPFEDTVNYHSSKWITGTYNKMKLWLKEAFLFIKALDQSIDKLQQLLSSENITDITESIKLIVLLNDFKVSGSKKLAITMFNSIYSKEVSISSEVLEAFNKIIIQSDSGSSHIPIQYTIAKNLSSFTQESTFGQMTSLEELVKESVKKGNIKDEVIEALWNIFTRKVAQFNKPIDIRGAIIILSLVSGYDHKKFSSKINSLIKFGLDFKDIVDPFIYKYTCKILQNLRYENGVISSKLPKFKNDNPIFESLFNLITSNDNVNIWTIYTAEAILAIYRLSENPEPLIGKIINSLSSKIEGSQQSANANFDDLCKLIFAVGHIGIKHLELIEEIVAEYRKEKLNKEKSKKKDGGDDDEDTMEKELGSAQAEAESEVDKFHESAELDLSSPANLVGRYIPFVREICLNVSYFNNKMVQAHACLALTKFMCIHHNVCSDNLQILFTQFRNSPYPEVKSNIAVGLSDLVVRFPNLIEPWSKHIYETLRDENQIVRNSALMSLTHLILNGMLKPKQFISELAICVEDPDHFVQLNAQKFFIHLSKKGNELYNFLPEIISKLTTEANNLLTSEKIRSILTFLFEFIKKDKQHDSLIERICLRFKTAKDIFEAQNISYCLQLLSFNEKSLRLLLENYKMYQDKLMDEEVNKNMCSIISKAKKNIMNKSNDLKLVLTELESKFKVKQDGDENGEDNGEDFVPPPTSQVKKPKKKPNAKDEDDMEIDEKAEVSDEDSDEDEEDTSPPVVAKPAARSKKAAPAKPAAAQSKKKPAARAKKAAEPPPPRAARSKKAAAASKKKKVESDSEDEDMMSISESESESEPEDSDSSYNSDSD